MHRRTFILLAALVPAGCNSDSGATRRPPNSTSTDITPSRTPRDTPTTPPRNETPPSSTARPILGVPEGWTLVPTATYSAIQRDGEVTVTATGENPTGGYQTKLYTSPLRIYPPQFILAHKKPDGLATQAFVPFAVTASFKATDAVAAVIVTDGAGKHEVKVTQPGQ